MRVGPDSAKAVCQRRDEVLGVLDPPCRHAHAAGHFAEVEFGSGEVEQTAGERPAGVGAHPVQLHVQDCVAPIGEDDRGDVESSRAWVHSAWRVYMALPSACRQRTGLSGAATAAPVAIGSPMPMAPP